MDETELQELQDPDTWEDDGEEEIHSPVKSARAVVSVAFTREDFKRVSDYAERHGLKTSEFIRKAALDRVASEHNQPTAGYVFVTESRWVHTEYPIIRLQGVKGRTQVKAGSIPSFTTVG
jgi:predicted ABC-class ATPase